VNIRSLVESLRKMAVSVKVIRSWVWMNMTWDKWVRKKQSMFSRLVLPSHCSIYWWISRWAGNVTLVSSCVLCSGQVPIVVLLEC